MIARERSRAGGAGRRLPVAAAMRLSEAVVRFLLAAALAGAEILGGHALFALSFVGVCPPGLEGMGALLGAALGYLSFRGVVGGLRYIAVCMMVYAVSLALGEFEIYRRRWFMPAVCAGLNALVGGVYQAAEGVSARGAVEFITEVVLTAGTTYFFRLALSVMDEPRGSGGLSVRQIAGVLVLGAAVMLALARVMVAERYSLGRVLCVLAVLCAGWKGGVGTGAVVGVAAGVAMDLSAGSAPCYTMAYALPGLVTGLFAGQNRLLCCLAYAASGGAAVLWAGIAGSESHVYEIVAGLVIFLILPERLLRRLTALVKQETVKAGEQNARRAAVRQLDRAAAAFRAVEGDLAQAFPPPEAKDSDALRVFDRVAERICVKCRERERCWQREYQTTRTALSDALGPMMDRGEGRREDFPPYFAQKCAQFEAFLRGANRELTALLYRRSYDSRIHESRAAVCAQYGQMARVLERTAAELGRDPTPDLPRQKLVKQRLAALGLEGTCAVWSDKYGHLRLEIRGAEGEKLAEGEELDRLGQLMGCPLRRESGAEDCVRLVQKEPLMAVAAVAAADRKGQTVNGDAGAWFKDEGGVLHVLLCDGMGSGKKAREDSTCALALLEKFLKAGLTPDETLATVGEALALRGEERGGFATVDLLRLDLFSGRGTVYKLGAAPTYLCHAGEVSALEGGSLPAGLAVGGGEPDRFPVKLEAGDWVVMASDGVSDGIGGETLRALIAGFDGSSPRLLADRILKQGEGIGREDDCTVIVLKLEARE
ncbi:MAG: SpoIIE family protein phosphatase [Oscillospiraceae bacterium]|nr:SpoIIE family protein phosphatase [Oscillospiraceae bacterium]